MIPRAVPWSCPEEWVQVRELLYSPDTCQRQLGVNRVKCWAARGRVPHAAETTSILVELGLQQELETSTCSSREMSYLLSMALIRFVNGIVDSGQKGTIASSALTIAEQVGLPSWFVELRHSATHDQIPLLQMLRNAQTQALEWLHDHYWEVQAGSAKGIIEIIDQLLDEYLILRRRETNQSKMQRLIHSIGDRLTDSTYSQILFPLILNRDVDFVGNADFYSIWEPFLTHCHKKWPGFAEAFFLDTVDMINALIMDKETFELNLAHLGTSKLILAAWAKCISIYLLNPWEPKRLDEAIVRCLETHHSM